MYSIQMKMTELLHKIQSKAQRYTDRKYSSASTENIIRLYLLPGVDTMEVTDRHTAK